MTINVGEVKRRLNALLKDDNLVNEYIRQYGPAIDIKNIKSVKESRRRCAAEQDEGDGQDPIYEIKLSCPVCNRDDIVCYELRAKSQQILQNKFLVPRYEPAPGYKKCEYSMLAVTVCPRCLFASPDKKDFIRQDSAQQNTVKSQLTSNVIMTLQEKIGERKAILKYISNYEEYFKRPRFDDAAIASYRLAMARASVEAWYEQPYSLYKMGAYALKIAQIIKAGNGDNREVLREAAGYYEESFRTSNCPTEEIEMQVIYTIVALLIKLGDLKKAGSYLTVFSNLHNSRLTEMKSNPALNTVTIGKWTDRAKRLWEDREMTDLFKEE
jgi:uncharacterized protein (DUF2225 family)